METKECPFCGSNDIQYFEVALMVNDVVFDSIACLGCGAQMFIDTPKQIPQEELIKAWNARRDSVDLYKKAIQSDEYNFIKSIALSPRFVGTEWRSKAADIIINFHEQFQPKGNSNEQET